MSRLQEAMAAVRANPKDSIAWSNLGELLLEAGQVEKSKESFQRALQLDTSNRAAQEGLSVTLTAGTAAQAVPPPATEMPDSAPAQEVHNSGPPGLAGSLMQEDMASSSAPAVPQDEGLGIDFPRPPVGDRGATGGERAIPRGEAPPMPQKPSEGRVKFGLTLMGMLFFVCACVLLLGLAAAISNLNINFL